MVFWCFQGVLKEISVTKWVKQVKKGSGASFSCTFSAYFFHKNVPTIWPSFNIRPNFFLQISNDVFKFLFSQLMASIIYLQSSTWAMADGRFKRGRGEYKNLNILRTKNFIWKTIFHIFLTATIRLNKEKWRTQDLLFKVSIYVVITMNWRWF